MVSRALGVIGRFLITTGIVVLLFVAYQLWGTGLQEAAAQNDLADDFETLLDEVGDDLAVPAPTTTATTEAATDGTDGTDDAAPATTVAPTEETAASTTTAVPFDTIPLYEEELAEALYRDGGEPIARIAIPTIGVRKVVVEGVRVEDLRNGPGHYRATVMPGQVGNSGVAGHRTTYGAPFNRIDELVPGDEINVRTVQGFHRYRVMPAGEAFDVSTSNPNVGIDIAPDERNLGHIIVRPSDTWVLSDFGDNRITLTACHPKFSAAKRIIVAAELITEPVDAPPPPPGYLEADDLAGEPVDESEATGVGLDAGDGGTADDGGRTLVDDEVEASNTVAADQFVDEVSLDEGLNGDRDAIRPAILWGLAAIAVYTFFKELFRRWRRWPAVALGIVPVVVLMALSFEEIDRALPAG